MKHTYQDEQQCLGAMRTCGTAMIQVVNKRIWKGGGYYVGRPTPLGNPFSHLAGTLAACKVGSRDEAIDRYRDWLENEMNGDTPAMRMFMSLLDEYERTGELTLICWCSPERCYAEIIKEFIEAVAHRR